MIVTWVALCALACTAFAESQEGEESTPAVCVDGFCYSLRTENRKFNMARSVCKKDGGDAVTVRTTVAAEAVLELLQAAGAQPNSRYWLGLQLHHKTCPDNGSLLRGYRWVDGDSDTTHYANWASAPSSSCGPRCVVVVVVASGQRWLEQPCNQKMDGVLCEYRYNGSCPRLANATVYHLPFGPRGSDYSSLPPGTLALVSPGERPLRCNGSRGWEPVGTAPWECRAGNGGCQHHCSDGPPPACSCRPGYRLDQGDKRSCAAVDPCEGLRCEHRCEVRSGSPLCVCEAGYRLDSDDKGCLDVDECQLPQPPSPCQHLICTNTEGSYTCSCPSGYQLAADGKCEDLNECKNQDPCQQGSCSNTQGSFTCSCQPGFQTDPDDHTKCLFYCDTKECRARCLGTFGCFCPPEYILNDDTGMCHSYADSGDSFLRPCIASSSGAKCQCEAGYQPTEDGTNCEMDEGSSADGPTVPGEPDGPARAGLSLGVVLGSLFAIAVLTLIFAGVGHHLLKKRGKWQTSTKYKATSLEQDVNLSQVATGDDQKLRCITSDNCNAGT